MWEQSTDANNTELFKNDVIWAEIACLQNVRKYQWVISTTQTSERFIL